MELGSWALISAPSILGLLPLLLFIVLALRGVENLSALIISVALGSILLGWDPGMLAEAFEESLSSSPALIALIMMMGAGIGALMSETKVSNALVYFIVDRIGVNSRTKAKISLCVCSILVSGLLGTSSGGNAVIAPIMIPIMATLGVTPTVVAALFKAAGEIGLILGPITGVTLMTLEVTGLSYATYMLQAGIPFATVWLIGTWIGCIRAQKRTEGYESYDVGEGLKDISRESITPKQVRATIAFLLLFVVLIAYGIITKQGSNYVLVVMVLLAAVLAFFSGTKLEAAVSCVVKGAKKQTQVLFIALCINVLLMQVTAAGGFEAFTSLIEGLATSGGPAGVMLIASLVGGFGIESSVVAEIQLIASMFGGMAAEVGLPAGCMALILLASTRLTGNTYPTTNFVVQMGISQCSNTKEVLQALWFGVGFLVSYLVIMAFVGPIIF